MTRFTYVLATFCAAALASAAALAGPLVAYGDEVILGPQSPPAEIAARLAPGMGNTLVAMADGRVCGWGQNFEGGLGRALDSSAWFSPDPACIDLPNGAAATAITSFRHAIALTADGDVYTWGAHSSGKLGIGPVEVNSFTPNLVTFPVSITATAVGAGADHSVALTEDGDIFTWGNNELGQLGNSGAGVEVDTPVKVAASGIEFAAVSSGWNHALAISRDGDVYAWGSDAMGQLGPDRVFDVDNDPENAGRGHPDWFSGVPGKVAGLPDHIAQVSAGADHSVALSENGDVYAWGSGQLGQLGNGATSGNYTTPVKINLPPIVGISAGAQYTVAWTAAGELYAWGANIDGNLGFGTNADVSTPHKVLGISVAAAVAGFSIQSYMRHTVAVDKDGRLVTWGNNDHTQLGDTSVPYDDQPRRVDGIPPIAYVAAGDGSTMAVSTGGELYAWGDNYGGVLGTDATEQRDVPTLVGGLSQVARVAIRDGHAVALDANADVWTWGRNGDGELGRVIGPDERPELVPDRVGLPEEAQKVTDLGAGSGFTMVLDADGQLWGWGANQPHLGSQVTPPSGTIQSREVVDIGLPERPVSGFAVDTGVGIALVDGTAYGLGHGESGQLGVDVTTVAVRSSVAIEGLGNRTIVQVDTTSGPRFAAGFTAAVDDEGTVWTLGRNASFQLGRQTDADGGDEADAVPGAVVGIPAIAAVSVGWTHAAALSRDGEVFAWGHWRHGNADTGNGSDIEWDDVKPVKVTGLPSRVVRIATGSDHTVALTEDGEVYTWGNNIEGQLGVASSNWSPDVRVTTLRMWESATTEPGIGDPDPCETSGEAPVLDGCEDPGTGDPDPCETSSEESVPEGCEDPGTGDPDPGDTNDPDTCDTAAGVSIGDTGASCEDPGTGGPDPRDTSDPDETREPGAGTGGGPPGGVGAGSDIGVSEAPVSGDSTSGSGGTTGADHTGAGSDVGAASIGGRLPQGKAPRLGRFGTRFKTVVIAEGTTAKLTIAAYPAPGTTTGAVRVAWKTAAASVASPVKGKSAGALSWRTGSTATLSLKAVKAGRTTVKLTSPGTRSATIQIKVVPKAKAKVKRLRTVELTGPTTLAVGRSTVLKPELTPVGAVRAIGRWRSTNPAVATVDAVGRVTAHERGRTVIVLTVKGKTATRAITVT